MGRKHQEGPSAGTHDPVRLLEDFFSSIVSDIVHCKRRVKDLLEYHNFYYSALAHQRAQIIDDLKHSLSSIINPLALRTGPELSRIASVIIRYRLAAVYSTIRAEDSILAISIP